MLRRMWVWIAFVLVHAVVIWLGFAGDHAASWDVDQLYRWWAGLTLGGDVVPGITEDWIYPPLAHLPILLVGALRGVVDYTLGWGLLVTALDAAAFAVLVGRGRSRGRMIAAWFWLAAILALGGVGMFRLDGVTVPIAVAGSLFLVGRPWLGSVLLAVATWIKVWPAALLAAAVIAVRRRLAVVGGAAAVSAVVVGVVLLAGGGPHLLGFVGDQTSRGLQIEAPVSSAYLLLALADVPGARIFYDPDLITFQITGPSVDTVIMLMTPVLMFGMLAIAVIGAVKAWRGASFVALFPPLALALVLGFIVLNKVGSPQYMTWLIAPVVVGLAIDRRRWLRPAVLTVVILALTQWLFPFAYDWLLVLWPAAVWLVVLRNVMLVALFAWVVVRLVRLPVRQPVALRVSE
ncbi:glycosyltransferase 87 family protein [Microbacterium sp. PRC9]|uniref:glycosyltransferase 87 family protein n=1 Tax=Microbacterium sp. PRC9 TaxID=2962591 RepID=UPI0028820726|nr:glycosyltransferase 87 family protein [Microbacterium sp. PRC9]MDT0144005.1 glycosyltransferase 87 family protein [Microbacterium sp. PRC9]